MTLNAQVDLTTRGTRNRGHLNSLRQKGLLKRHLMKKCCIIYSPWGFSILRKFSHWSIPKIPDKHRKKYEVSKYTSKPIRYSIDLKNVTSPLHRMRCNNAFSEYIIIYFGSLTIFACIIVCIIRSLIVFGPIWAQSSHIKFRDTQGPERPNITGHLPTGAEGSIFIFSDFSDHWLALVHPLSPALTTFLTCRPKTEHRRTLAPTSIKMFVELI